MQTARLSRGLMAVVLAAMALIASSARAQENSWIAIGPVGGGGHIFALAIDSKDPATVYTGYSYQGLWKTTDSGATWFQTGTGLTNWEFAAIATAPSDPSTLYCATSGGVFTSTDHGSTWQGPSPADTIGQLQAIAVHPSTKTTAFAAGGNCVHAYCGTGGVARTTDGGLSWQPTTLTDVVFDLVTLPGPFILFARGLNSVYESADAGSTWTDLPLSFFPTALAASAGPPQTLYAADYPGGIYRSTDFGATWQKALAAGLENRYVTALAVDGVTPATLYAAAQYYDEALYRSTDGGDHWTKVRLAPSVTRIAAPLAAHGPVWVASNGYGLLRSDPTGATWGQVANVFRNLDVFQLVPDPASSGKLYARTSGGLYKTLDGGGSWQRLPLETQLSTIAIAASDSEIVYAGLPLGQTSGGMIKSTDGGQTWNAVGAGLPQNDLIIGLGVNPASPSTVLAGTELSGAFRTTDGGATWSPVPGLADLQVIASFTFDSTNPSIFYASSYQGSRRSDDGGATWHDFGPVLSSIVLDPSSPTTIWGTASSLRGPVWKSVDGGASWLPASAGLPFTDSRALLLDPVFPSTAYFGWEGGVFRTLDGGATWSPLNEGLGNTGIDSLALTAGGELVLYAGTQADSAFRLTVREPNAPCLPGPSAHCLGGGRFRVEVSFRSSAGSASTNATTLFVSSETGGFWFFDPDNLELIVKVLDGRVVNGHWWVFYGALSNVEYTITVTDTQTGALKTYFNPQGQLASFADTNAF